MEDNGFRGYAKYDDGDTIWELYEDEESSYDISIDDIQGDIMICDVEKERLKYASILDYRIRIKTLRNEEIQNE